MCERLIAKKCVKQTKSENQQKIDKFGGVWEQVKCVLIEQRRYFRYITIAVPLLHFIIYPVQKFRTSQTHTVQLPEL